jgi:hypothetical protein
MVDFVANLECPELPDTPQACRDRLIVLRSEIASIRTQIATTDIRRQTEKKTLDAGWYHRAKTALRVKQFEQALLQARLEDFNAGGQQTREGLRNAILRVVRMELDDERWAALIERAKLMLNQGEVLRG